MSLPLKFPPKHQGLILTVPPFSTTAISVGWYTLLLKGALGLLPKLPLRNPAVRRAGEGGSHTDTKTVRKRDSFVFLPCISTPAHSPPSCPLSQPDSQQAQRGFVLCPTRPILGAGRKESAESRLQLLRRTGQASLLHLQAPEDKDTPCTPRSPGTMPFMASSTSHCQHGSLSLHTEAGKSMDQGT